MDQGVAGEHWRLGSPWFCPELGSGESLITGAMMVDKSPSICSYDEVSTSGICIIRPWAGEASRSTKKRRAEEVLTIVIIGGSLMYVGTQAKF